MDSKNIKDYLHLYLGCGCIMKGDNSTRTAEWSSVITWADIGYPHKIKVLILRPLSDMTEEESKESRKIFDSMVAADKLNCEIEAARTLFALSKGFDLFNLIEAGLAIKKSS